MNRLFMLTRAEGSALVPDDHDVVVLLGAALALVWQQHAWLSLAANAGHLYAMNDELQHVPSPPVSVQALPDHKALLDLILNAGTVIGSQ